MENYAVALEYVLGNIQYEYKSSFGFLHRLDGPALICTNGNVYYYINGKQYSKEEWEPYNLKWRLINFKCL